MLGQVFGCFDVEKPVSGYPTRANALKSWPQCRLALDVSLRGDIRRLRVTQEVPAGHYRDFQVNIRRAGLKTRLDPLNTDNMPSWKLKPISHNYEQRVFG
jgi:hypothetical protein